MKKSVLKEKSFKFAVRIVNLYKHLCDEKKEFVLSKQILRSGTSVGAMVREFDSINNDAVELIKMITSSIKTAKSSLTTNH
ncbi:hypothetical protein AGMMS50239_06710 [Bacteroidia bacterium]|nr:hypothetical protein FACS1894207_4060 [Bacteroidia bacterium]GHT59632.1 hypothetical protein AGMMS50239_06710 [Bacteroidia bacterium]